ncbi:MAG: hypothetical protein SOV58_04565 [Candidatus Enteromonas sp.]|nr:hypothetical protein [Candidatus Enteromonas sp.]
MKKKLKRKETLKLGLAILALLFFGGGLTVSGVVYVNSVDETVYQESVAHLTEIYRQSTDSLNKTVSRNWSAMDVWTYYLKEHSDENEVKEFLDGAQQAIHFTGFLFISEDNGIETRTLDGQEGRLLVPQETISSLLEDHEDIMANIPVAGQGQAMLFAVPCEGTFGTFQYDAIGAYFNSDDLISTITVNAFEGKASSLLIHKDGRIILEKSSGLLPPSHNLFATLRGSSLNEDQLKSLKESIKKDGCSGNTSFRYAGKTYYLVFQSLDFQKWVVVGIVPADTVNLAMGKLQTSTILFVTAVTVVLVTVLSGVGLTLFRNSLKKKDAEIQYREELFSCLSTSVDDIFLMLSANSYAVQYVSPNVERLLGIPQAKSMKA